MSCADFDYVYTGETGRTLEKRPSEHRGAVKRNDSKNSIAVHTCLFCIVDNCGGLPSSLWPVWQDGSRELVTCKGHELCESGVVMLCSAIVVQTVCIGW